MINFVIKAADEATMFAAFDGLGLRDEEGTLRQSGRNPGERHEWAMSYLGVVQDRDNQTGTDGEGNPIFADLPGVYTYLRWNGDKDQTAYWAAVNAFGLTKYWASDGSGDNADLPDWFPRIG